MILWILTIAFLSTISAQSIDIQDLTNNNGYIPIKTGEQKVIDRYNKILHIVNVTAYTDTLNLIYENLQTLDASTVETKTLLDTINKNFALLKGKVDGLNPHLRQRRGLINVLGKGLKFIAGTMDNDDDLEISNSLKSLYKNEESLTNQINNLTFINYFISTQIRNITEHINQKQIIIGNYLNEFKHYIQNKITTIEDEIKFMEHIYQINNDISLLRDHVDDIGQIIFSSKLGIIPTDILTNTELDLMDDFDSYTGIKIAVALHDNNIIIILQIPQFSKEILSKIIFEPIPNTNNKTIILNNYEMLIDSKNNIFDVDIKDNLKKNLIQISNKCISSILNYEEAYCDMRILHESSVTEILPGVLIFKNFYFKVEHNCNKIDIKISGNFLIKFENCEINTNNKTFNNVKLKFYDQFILPNIITKIKEKSNNFPNLKLESLYLKQIEHEKYIQQIQYQTKKSNFINININIIIVITIIILVIFTTYKTNKKLSILHISSEPQSNSGGVIAKHLNII